MSWVPFAEMEILRRDKDERIDKLEREIYRLQSIIDGLSHTAALTLAEKMQQKDTEIAQLQIRVAHVTEQRDQGLKDYAHLAQQNAELRRKMERV